MNFTNKNLAFRNTTWQYSLLLIFFLNFIRTNAEEVCKLFFIGYPEDLLEIKELVVPDNTVGLSEYIKVGYPARIPDCPPCGISIFFIIDNSTSMTRMEKDRSANRFTVIRDMIDTIIQQMPKAEVGLAVFKQDLEFSVEDSPYFAIPPNRKRPYLQLMKLDSTYENNQQGSDIIKKYLESEIGADGIGEMKYKPSDPLPYSMYKTNINIGFDAARHAMKSSRWEKHKQFVIFISDGEANQPQDGTKNDFTKGIDIPTTFTIFFSRNKKVPGSIELMTENIRKNGYSASNPLSMAWGYDNSFADAQAIAESKARLSKFLMENIMVTLLRKAVKKPTSISVNGLEPVSKWGDSLGYIFNEIFPLTGTKTDFLQKITYTIFYEPVMQTQEIITIEGEKAVQEVKFSVKIVEHAQNEENLLFECWDRTLKFFYNNTPIDIADETMGELEIRFIEDKIDMLYGYEDVTVEISNTGTKKTDLEKFRLDDRGTHLGYTFTREIETEPLRSDQKLGHAHEDSIIAVFRNPDLPLDTLRYGIPFRRSPMVGLISREGVDPYAGDNHEKHDSGYRVVGLIPRGTNPYDRNTPEKHEIPSHILKILKEDNAAEIEKSSPPNCGMLLRVIPEFIEAVDTEKVMDFFLEGKVTIFDPLGNTVIDDREMGFHRDTKSLNFVWNGRNTVYNTCGTGPYIALFKVTGFKGPYRKNMGDAILKLVIYLK